MNAAEFTALLLCSATSFTPGPNTTLSAALATNLGLRVAMRFVLAVVLVASVGYVYGAQLTPALGGALRVSQTQLLQPFLSILATVPLLGEPLELMTVGFALTVVATVFLGKRFPK